VPVVSLVEVVVPSVLVPVSVALALASVALSEVPSVVEVEEPVAESEMLPPPPLLSLNDPLPLSVVVPVIEVEAVKLPPLDSEPLLESSPLQARARAREGRIARRITGGRRRI